MSENVSIELGMSKVINFSMQQNHVPIIRSIKIKNLSTTEDLHNIKVKITSQPEFLYEWTIIIDMIPREKIYEIDTVAIKLVIDYLYSLTERISGLISIKVSSEDEVLLEENYDIDVLAYDEWAGTLIMPEMICALAPPGASDTRTDA